MTSLLPPRAAGPRLRPTTPRPGCAAPSGRWCWWPRSAGVAAALAPLLVLAAVGVVGWFLTDAGAHGTPRDGLRVGALAG